MRGFFNFFRGATDDRFCHGCGREMEVVKQPVHDGRTGAIRRFRWAVHCPELSVWIQGDDHWRISGAFPEHTCMFLRPTWEPQP